MRAQNVKSLMRKAALLIVLLSVAITSGTLTLSLTAKNHSHSSVTGYFGLDDEGMPIVDRHGIMLVFDGAIAPETVSAATFDVFHDESSQAEVVDAHVDGAYVFLKLKEELASDATPVLMITEGAEVEDLAGNSTNRRKLGAVRVKDGIAPKLTVELSGGSGRGTGDEGPNRLTNNTIDIRITSDEPLQGAPRIVVACSELSWMERASDGDARRDINDFIANRNGPLPRNPSEPPDTVYTCGYDADRDGNDDAFELTEDIGRSRPGEVWNFTWRNPAGAVRSLRDGELVVVAYGRDRSSYVRYGETVSNWSTATVDFGLDTQLDSLSIPYGVNVYPEDGSQTSERRPFVLIEFPQTEAVTLKSVIFDGGEIVGDFQYIDNRNSFVYWPESMNRGRHKFEVEAQDAAGNSVRFHFGFETVARGDFVVELLPGWNAISFPVCPTNRFVPNVFTEPSIQAVVGWYEGRWSMVIRRNGSWEYSAQYEPFEMTSLGYGYWVKSSEYVRQPVALLGWVPERSPGPCPPPNNIPPVRRGWNFVGVIDVDGDQTEDHFGEVLKNSVSRPVSAREYLGSYQDAYTWEPSHRRFDRLLPNDLMIIGDGIWVYYSEMGSE